MKKTILVLALIVAFAASSFASVSFLTATGVGEGKCALLGLYAATHNGDLGGQPDVGGAMDATSIGVRIEYGLMKDVDILAAYSMDNLININDFGDPYTLAVKQIAGSTTDLGIKYTFAKDGDKIWGMTALMDMAVAGGIETSTATIKAEGEGSIDIGGSSMSLGAIFSKKMGMFIPYGAIAYKSLTANNGRDPQTGVWLDPVSGVGLALNIGMYIGVAANQAIAIEYNTENQSYGDLTSHGKTKILGGAASLKDTGYSKSVSAISLGYVYMF